MNLERIRTALVGVAAGLLLAVFYLRGATFNSDALNELRDGALLLLVVSIGVTIWLANAAKRQRRS